MLLSLAMMSPLKPFGKNPPDLGLVGLVKSQGWELGTTGPVRDDDPEERRPDAPNTRAQGNVAARTVIWTDYGALGVHS